MTTMPTQVGPFTVEREIARGGMGVVYLANDPRLGRKVAIKSLPPDLASNPDRLARFDREARTLASLHHANVASILGVEEQDGHRYLVLEYVEGETLQDAIERGPIAMDDALRLASRIASGIQAAHDAGVIHRDLKPANVRVTAEHQPKILDFGIAKPAEASATTTSSIVPTASFPQTAEGAIIGTVHYMSPEQARGKPLDKRTDLWSFAVVLYEMLTGRSPFVGETTTDVLAAIVEREPDYSALPANTPTRVRELLRKCLAKDREKRLRDIGDARIEIDLAIEGREWSTTSLTAALPDAPSGGRWLVPVLGIALAAVSLLAIVQPMLAPAPAPRDAAVVRYSIDPLEGLDGATSLQRRVQLSPDGSTIAYGVFHDGRYVIRLRDLAAYDARTVAFSDDAWMPSFSPDSRWVVASVAGRSLVRAPVDGGPLQTVCDLPWHSRGSVAWLNDDEIAFMIEFGGKLSLVPAAGGEPRVLFEVPSAGVGVTGIENLCPVPGGGAVLATLWDGTSIEDYNIIAILEDGTSRPVIENAAHPALLGPSTLVFLRDATLLAAPFDVERLELIGEPRTLVEGVSSERYGGTALYDAGPNGTLVYVPGDRRAKGRSIVRVSLDGAVTTVSREPDAFMEAFEISPDGKLVVLATIRRRYELWAYDLERHTTTLIQRRGEYRDGAWSPDGSRFIFCVSEEGDASGTTKIRSWDRASGVATDLALPEAWYHVDAVTNDGDLVAYTNESGGIDTMSLVELDPETGAAEVLDPLGNLLGTVGLTPDEKWMAYRSFASGRPRLFLRPYGADGRAVQITSDLASDGPYIAPGWNERGGTLYYASDVSMMAVDVAIDGQTVTPGEPRVLFAWPFGDANIDWDACGITPEGDFLMIAPAPWERERPRINVVLNADAELR